MGKHGVGAVESNAKFVTPLPAPAAGFISSAVSLIGLCFGFQWMVYQDEVGRWVTVFLAHLSAIVAVIFIAKFWVNIDRLRFGAFFFAPLHDCVDRLDVLYDDGKRATYAAFSACVSSWIAALLFRWAFPGDYNAVWAPIVIAIWTSLTAVSSILDFWHLWMLWQGQIASKIRLEHSPEPDLEFHEKLDKKWSERLGYRRARREQDTEKSER